MDRLSDDFVIVNDHQLLLNFSNPARCITERVSRFYFRKPRRQRRMSRRSMQRGTDFRAMRVHDGKSRDGVPLDWST